MSEPEQRHIIRDSLFVMANLRLYGTAREVRVKIRNLSTGGLMAEGDVRVAPGNQVAVEIRNVGWVNGAVAWVQDNRFGIAFANEIDPKAARGQAVSAVEPPEYYARRPLAVTAQAIALEPGALRKI